MLLLKYINKKLLTSLKTVLIVFRGKTMKKKMPSRVTD